MTTTGKADLLLRTTSLSRRAREARADGLPADVAVQITTDCCGAIDRLRRGELDRAAAVLDRAEERLDAALAETVWTPPATAT